MKRVVLGVLIILCLPLTSMADKVTLNSQETLSVPTSIAMQWKVTLIDATTKTLQVSYRWMDSNWQPIQKSDSRDTWRVWTCQDRVPQLVTDCTARYEPYACCTGVGTGSGCDPGSTCFSDVFGFTIRSQDVGTKIGVGLRTLIWNKFRPAVLTGSNNGTFDTD